MKPRLYVLAPSHYCERARWALQHRGIDFEEVALAPGPHAFKAKKLSGSTKLPLLQTADGVVVGSSAIMSWAGLEGGDPEVEQRVEAELGVQARRMVYAGLLNETPEHAVELLFDGASAGSAFIGRVMWPLTRRVMISGLRTQAKHIPAIERAIADELTWLESRLDGKHYFVGDTFGRTDMTVASLLTPLVLPPDCTMYTKVRVPPGLRGLFDRWSSHPVFSYVRRIYSEHRR
jgi:glutathione S-transferase